MAGTSHEQSGKDATRRIKEDAIASVLNKVSVAAARRRMSILCLGLPQVVRCLGSWEGSDQPLSGSRRSGLTRKLEAAMRIARQHKRNAMDDITYMRAVDGVLGEATSLLICAGNTAEQAGKSDIHEGDRRNLNADFQKVSAAAHHLVERATYRGLAVFTPSAAPGNFTLAVGSEAGWAFQLPGTTHSLASLEETTKTRQAIATTLESIRSIRRGLDASIQQRASDSGLFGIQVENLAAASSPTWDMNLAGEIVNLTKFQILNQSGVGTLGQADQTSQRILALLR